MIDFVWLYVIVGIYYTLGLITYGYISYKNKSKYTYLSAVQFDENEYTEYFDTEYAEN